MISEQTPIPCSPSLITRVYPSEWCTPGALGLGCARAGGGVGGEGTHAFIKPHLISGSNTFLKLSRFFQERNCFQNARPSHIKVSGMPVGELELTPKRDQSGRGLALRFYLTHKGGHSPTKHDCICLLRIFLDAQP